jgi:hypothetical protein
VQPFNRFPFGKAGNRLEVASEMIFVFVLVLIFLLVVGAYQSRLRQATLHWGRIIAGLGHVQRDIDQAKDSDPGLAGYLLGRSVHQRGLQDAITPPWLANFTFLHWALCLGTFIWGFFILPWYVALTWPVAFVIGGRIFRSMLPRPDSDFYRKKLIAVLETRCNQFRRVGDDMRIAAAEHMAGLLRGSDGQPETPDFESFLLERITQNPHISLEDTLTDYIARYRLNFRKSLDEPESISAARTRLQILEETVYADPNLCPYPQLHDYISALRAQVQMGDELHPDILAAMRARERKKT